MESTQTVLYIFNQCEPDSTACINRTVAIKTIALHCDHHTSSMQDISTQLLHVSRQLQDEQVTFIQFWNALDPTPLPSLNHPLPEALRCMIIFRDRLVKFSSQIIKARDLRTLIFTISAQTQEKSNWDTVVSSLQDDLAENSIIDLSRGIFIWLKSFIETQKKKKYRTSSSTASSVISQESSELKKRLHLAISSSIYIPPSCPPIRPCSISSFNSALIHPTVAPQVEKLVKENSQLQRVFSNIQRNQKESVKTSKSVIQSFYAQNRENEEIVFCLMSRAQREQRLLNEIEDLKSQLLTVEAMKADCDLEIRSLRNLLVTGSNQISTPQTAWAPVTLPSASQSVSGVSAGLAIGGDFLGNVPKKKKKQQSKECIQQ